MPCFHHVLLERWTLRKPTWLLEKAVGCLHFSFELSASAKTSIHDHGIGKGKYDSISHMPIFLLQATQRGFSDYSSRAHYWFSIASMAFAQE